MRLTVEDLDHLYGTEALEVFRRSRQGHYSDFPRLVSYLRERTCPDCGNQVSNASHLAITQKLNASGVPHRAPPGPLNGLLPLLPTQGELAPPAGRGPIRPPVLPEPEVQRDADPHNDGAPMGQPRDRGEGMIHSPGREWTWTTSSCRSR